MAGTGRLAARRKARLLPTGRVAHGLAQRSRAVHPLPPPRLETEQRSSPPPLPPPCAVRPTRRHSAPRHCSTWGPTAASAAAAAAGPQLRRHFRFGWAGTQDAASQAWNLQLRSPETGTHAYGTYWRGPTLTVRGPTVAIPPAGQHPRQGVWAAVGLAALVDTDAARAEPLSERAERGGEQVLGRLQRGGAAGTR